ncbi:MAG: hypothetical protein ABL911_05135 [Gallionella sp.]|nr:hypothetical protein [Gallionella sp.]
MNKTLIAFAFLGLLALVLWISLYLSIRYSSGRFGGPRTSEVLLVASCATSLCFLPWADLVDSFALVAYVIAVSCIRLLIMKRPFREPEIIFHMAILYLSLSRLDKVTGYGNPNQFLVLAQYIFLTVIASSCIYLIFSRRNTLALGALFLLFFPVSHFPLELARNLAAREMAPNAEPLYVTKLYSGEIYGLRLEKGYGYRVDRFALVDGVFQKKHSNLLPNGREGTLDPQIPIVASWEWKVVEMLFDKQRA